MGHDELSSGSGRKAVALALIYFLLRESLAAAASDLKVPLLPSLLLLSSVQGDKFLLLESE